jgi:predicted 3-demethylubiquinone-9 3-methyltransferase (glyoxalase superfamily)
LSTPFGLSWQIVPVEMEQLMADHTSKKAERVMAAMLQMKKLDIAKLRQAAAG